MSKVMSPTTKQAIGALGVLLSALSALPAGTLAAGTLAADEPPTPGLLFNAKTELRYDDNVYRTRSNERSDGIAVVKPELAWTAEWAASRLSLGYRGDFGRYLNESDLNYNNDAFGTYLQLDHSARLRTAYTLGYERKADEPGSTDELFVEGDKPVKWRNSLVAFRLDYGSTGSQGQLALQAGYNEKRYVDNDQEYRDFDGAGGTATFYYRVAPRTRLLMEADYTEYDYTEEDSFGGNQSGDNSQLLAGVTWEATGKTTGVFKIGYRDRTYEDQRFDGQSGLAVYLDGTWQPNSYTSITFGAARDNQNSGQRGSGGSVNTSGYVAVVRDISKLLRFRVNAGYSNEAFEDFANRDDDRWDAALGLEYSLVHWLDVGVAYRFENRDSNVDIYDFTDNIILLTANTRFGK